MWDEAAIAELYQRHGFALFQRCYSLLGNRADAEELLQETFCQFCTARHRFLGKSSAFTYLYRIATNLSIDRLRRRHTAGPAVPLDEPAAVATAVDTQASRRMFAARELAVLTRNIDEQTLTIAVLAHVDGMTQDEIALTLDLSRRTVGKRLKQFEETTRMRAAGDDKTLASFGASQEDAAAQVESAHGD